MSIRPSFARGLRVAAALAAPLLLGACNLEVLFPAGDVARQELQLIVISTVLMLLIIVPVMALTVLFAWRYRRGNENATYRPDWDHSTALELIIWSAPLLIIVALGAVTWITTHTLDPYRRLGRIDADTPIAADARPLEVQVVALDWKWLFIYPEQGIATVNELALPVGREVRFRLTASSVMNSFYVPALAGQVYAMPAMETKLHAVFNKTGDYKGFSANYSGSGFSKMRFTSRSMDQAGFDRWVAARRAAGGLLDRRAYLALERPSEDVTPKGWATVEPGLFQRAVEMCVREGVECMGETMRRDMGHHPAKGGHGTPPAANTSHPQPGGQKPALLRKPEELGTSPFVGDAPTDAPAIHNSHN